MSAGLPVSGMASMVWPTFPRCRLHLRLDDLHGERRPVDVEESLDHLAAVGQRFVSLQADEARDSCHDR